MYHDVDYPAGTVALLGLSWSLAKPQRGMLLNPSAFSGDNLISKQIENHGTLPMRPEANRSETASVMAALLERRGKETAISHFDGIR